MSLFLSILSWLFVVLVFLPLVRDSFWLFRTLEYPRFQKFIIAFILLGLWIVPGIRGELDPIACGLLVVCVIYLFIKIFPYTPFSPKQVLTVKSPERDISLRIFCANVYQKNRNYQAMIREIRSCDPDIILLVETDEEWNNALKELSGDYAYHIARPLSNTYGMVFYSRLQLEDERVRFIVKADIPSIDTKLRLRCGKLVQLYCLHPEPPVPGESMRSTAKDKELMKVANFVAGNELPCIVLGDLNDVAWSYTTSLFKKISGLLDVRCGRGFYSTFSAKIWFFRFPLDYIFCSAHFGLHEMKRLHANGSDHFPIFTHLSFRPDLVQEQRENRDKPTEKEKRDAEELRRKGETG